MPFRRGYADLLVSGSAQSAARLLDAGRDGGAELDRPADRAEVIVRPLHRGRQQRPGRVAALARREPDPERHGDVGQQVAALLVANLLRAGLHNERVRLGAPRGEDVHVDRRASGDRGQQQLDRREVGTAPDGDLAAALIGGGVRAVRDALERHLAMRLLTRHGSTMPEAGQDSSRRTSTTPARMRAPPRNCVADGVWCSSSQAKSTANRISAIATNEPSLAPSRRAAPMPAMYASAAATSARPRTATSQLTRASKRVTSAADMASGAAPVSPRKPSAKAPTTIPPLVMTTGGSGSASDAADRKK